MACCLLASAFFITRKNGKLKGNIPICPLDEHYFKLVEPFYRPSPCLTEGAGYGHPWGGGLLRQLNNLLKLVLSNAEVCECSLCLLHQGLCIKKNAIYLMMNICSLELIFKVVVGRGRCDNLAFFCGWLSFCIHMGIILVLVHKVLEWRPEAVPSFNSDKLHDLGMVTASFTSQTICLLSLHYSFHLLLCMTIHLLEWGLGMSVMQIISVNTL